MQRMRRGPCFGVLFRPRNRALALTAHDSAVMLGPVPRAQKKQSTTSETVIMTNKYSTHDLDLDKAAELRDLEGGARDI